MPAIKAAKIEVLQAAAERIANYDDRFICLALDALRMRAGDEWYQEACAEMENFVFNRLLPHSTLETWTQAHLPETIPIVRDMSAGAAHDLLREHFRDVRLKWIAYIITQLEESDQL